MSPQWAICTRARSTPSSSKISTWRGPVATAGIEWAMIGAPVLQARAGDRPVDLLHLLGHPGRVGGALQEGRPDVGPLDPLSRCPRRSGRPSRRCRGSRSSGGGSRSCRCRCRRRSARRSASATRFMKRTSRPPNIAVGSTIVSTPRSLAAPTASQRGVQLGRLVVAIGPLRGDRLVAKADVLVDQHEAQLARCRPAPALSARLAILRLPPRSVLAERLAPVGLLAQLRLQQLAARIARQRLLAHRRCTGAP